MFDLLLFRMRVGPLDTRVCCRLSGLISTRTFKSRLVRRGSKRIVNATTYLWCYRTMYEFVVLGERMEK